jgi:hypothetical protein
MRVGRKKEEGRKKNEGRREKEESLPFFFFFS